ncbi:hypothetical protein PVAP13_7KG031700 [Panicum virgatum]|uniref:Uncharacterized protein n=1 Tax=Panicum virgatum TaxID=38727 RepID=A0A8T0Q7N6_PANVG|nr:hypothetical protein PVAP13_7KG031700 [Panicum virgatum]
MQVKGDCEEKFQQFKEEESNKLQALQEEFTAALAASRGTPFVEAAPKSIAPSEATPTVQKAATKTLVSKPPRSVSQNNKNYISTHQLMNAAVKCVRTRSQQV